MHSTSGASSESGCSWADLSQFGSFLANCGTWGQHGHEWDALSFFDVVLVLRSVFKHKEWLRLLSTVLGCSLSSSLRVFTSTCTRLSCCFATSLLL